MHKLLLLAAQYAIPKYKDERHYWLGAVGVRSDKCIVHSSNSPVLDTKQRTEKGSFSIYQRFPQSHAEHRLTRKLDNGALVYVARVMKGSKKLAMARPCVCCRNILASSKVDKVYYTISDTKYGIWYPTTDRDVIYEQTEKLKNETKNL